MKGLAYFQLFDWVLNDSSISCMFKCKSSSKHVFSYSVFSNDVGMKSF